jgi:hypothetical protein
VPSGSGRCPPLGSAVRLRTPDVVGVVEALGDKAADADLAEVVEEGADLIGGTVDVVGVLVEKGQEHFFAPLPVAGLAGSTWFAR